LTRNTENLDATLCDVVLIGNKIYVCAVRIKTIVAHHFLTDMDAAYASIHLPLHVPLHPDAVSAKPVRHTKAAGGPTA
jgi:hypothetical protein